jgi:hypothetical protein
LEGSKTVWPLADEEDVVEDGNSVLQTQRSAEPVSKSRFRDCAGVPMETVARYRAFCSTSWACNLSVLCLQKVLNPTYWHVACLTTGVFHGEHVAVNTRLATNTLIVSELPSLADLLDST